MTKAKKILNIITVVVITALVACTVLSKVISEAMRPKVEITTPVEEFVEIDGKKDYYYFIPDSTIFTLGTRNCVYVVRDERGLFGNESHLVLCDISILGQMDGMTAYGGRYLRSRDRVVLEPDPSWEDGAAVTITNLPEEETE